MVMLEFISKYGTAVIILLGIVITALLLWNGSALSNQKSKLKEALLNENNVYSMNGDTGEMKTRKDESTTVTPDTIRRYETEFYKKCSWHGVLVQCIPVFPLLGILGTVAGLMLQMQANGMDAMMDSLDVALDTTYWGLIFAILLKVIEAVYPSRVIYDAEVLLDDFDKKMNLAEMFQKVKKEKK